MATLKELEIWRVKSVDGKPIQAFPHGKLSSDGLTYRQAQAEAEKLIREADWTAWYPESTSGRHKIDYELEACVTGTCWTDGAYVRDAELREATTSYLVAKHRGEGAVIINELGWRKGRVRADVVLVRASQLEGFELKGETDSFARFSKQCELYSRAFAKASLVVAEPYLRQAKRRAPSWWGIYTLSRGADALEVEREPSANPNVDPHFLVQLIWRTEAMKILGKKGADRVGRRAELWRRIAEQYSVEELQEVVCETLRRRVTHPSVRDGRWSSKESIGAIIVDEEPNVRPPRYNEAEAA